MSPGMKGNEAMDAVARSAMIPRQREPVETGIVHRNTNGKDEQQEKMEWSDASVNHVDVHMKLSTAP